jgi:hypothetical protein
MSYGKIRGMLVLERHQIPQPLFSQSVKVLEQEALILEIETYTDYQFHQKLPKR